MTCLERLKQDHPEWSQEDIDQAIRIRCPHHSGGITIDKPAFCCGYDAARCEACWNREIPGTEPTPVIKDSGNRTEFESGAVRDIQEGKGRCDLLPLDVVHDLFATNHMADKVWFRLGMFTIDGAVEHLHHCLLTFRDDAFGKSIATMLLEVSKHFEEGAKKYGEDNWKNGLPVRCYINSAVRHYLKWLRGDKDEPHDRAFCWNIICAIWTCIHKPELNDYRKEDNNA